jgi:NADH-quinone oxidoreductase subunit N
VEQFGIIANEVLLTILAFLVLGIGIAQPGRRDGKAETYLAAGGLLVILAASFGGLMPCAEAFGGVYRVGPTAVLFKRIFLIAGVLTALLSLPASGRHELQPRGKTGEYLGLLILSITGMSFLVSAQEATLMYVGLELVTIPLIALVAFNRRELRSAEAGLKYVFCSALASGLLLYGISLLYGMTGTTTLDAMAGKVVASPLAVVALVLVMGGVGFKISAAPFHLWTPDTYEGAPVTITAFLSVASKAAGFVLFYKIVAVPFRQSAGLVLVLVALMAVITMTFGNLVALHQTRLKRFLAYSSIAQAGYLLIGLTNTGALGQAALVYYLMVYLFSNLAAFAVIIIVAEATGLEDMRDYTGFSETNPRLAFVMMLAMFSLAGIPPLAGFLGKFYLFAAASERSLYWLVFVGAVNSTISLYYYLIVIKWMYIVKPAEGQEPIPPLTVGLAGKVVLVVTTGAMIAIGVVPHVIRWTESAVAVGF